MPNEHRELEELMEESHDLQSDAVRATRDAIEELVEARRDGEGLASSEVEQSREFARARRELLKTSLVGAGALAGFGAALLALMDSPAFADQSMDIQMLQTSASIEVLAVATYKTAMTLPFIGGSAANPVVSKFVQTTMSQHQQHLQAFNSAVQALGGKPQNNPDPKYNAVVQQAVPTIKGPADVVGLALKLEDVAAQTYVANAGALSDKSAKKVTASIMGVEAQHVAVLRAVQALLKANAPQLITLPPPVGQLPAAAGSVGFPDAFYPTSMASPASEGAVR
jgi:hypothetical protein